MTASLVRTISNQIGKLELKSIPGENVAKLGETIVTMVKKIECSSHVPKDLLNLVAKPYTTGTQRPLGPMHNRLYHSGRSVIQRKLPRINS